MAAITPAGTVEQLVEAVNSGNIEGAVSQYEAGAAFVAQPENVVAGTAAVRSALEGFIALKPKLTTRNSQVIQSGDVALYCSDWTLKGTGPDGSPIEMAGRSSDVLRRQADGTWLIVVDNPWGTAVLGEGGSQA